MKKLLLIPILFLFVSCGSNFEVNQENVANTYKGEDRSLNLTDENINGFVNLNGYMSGTEVNNIYVQDNNIEWLDISDYEDLWTLDISNNNIRFIWDLKLPLTIRHLNLSWNILTSLKWIEKYTKLKTLDISNNNITDDEIDISPLENLLYINMDNNPDMSDEKINATKEFNSIYLSTNPKPFSE